MWTLYILVNNLKMPTTITVITNHFKKKKKSCYYYERRKICYAWLLRRLTWRTKLSENLIEWNKSRWTAWRIGKGTCPNRASDRITFWLRYNSSWPKAQEAGGWSMRYNLCLRNQFLVLKKTCKRNKMFRQWCRDLITILKRD